MIFQNKIFHEKSIIKQQNLENKLSLRLLVVFSIYAVKFRFSIHMIISPPPFTNTKQQGSSTDKLIFPNFYSFLD